MQTLRYVYKTCRQVQRDGGSAGKVLSTNSLFMITKQIIRPSSVYLGHKVH